MPIIRTEGNPASLRPRVIDSSNSPKPQGEFDAEIDPALQREGPLAPGITVGKIEVFPGPTRELGAVTTREDERALVRETGIGISTPDPKRFLLLSPVENRVANLAAENYPAWSLGDITLELGLRTSKEISVHLSRLAKKLRTKNIDETVYYGRYVQRLTPEQQLAGMSFGEALRFFMAREGMSHQELMELSGLSSVTLSKFKNNPSPKPRLGSLQKIVEALGWEADDPRIKVWLTKLPESPTF